MAADHFCLRWNNYQSNMVSELDTLRSEEHLVDVTLSCEGQKFRAHKVILSACSAYFRNVFKENPCEHPVVILKDVNHEDVEALLSFVYQGVVYVSEKKLASFLQTAELLQIKGLTGAASTFKDEQGSSLTEKGGPPPLTPTRQPPSRRVLPSMSPPPSKRRKSAPVRILKQGDGGEGSDTNSNQGGEDDSEHISVKQEQGEDIDTRQSTPPPGVGEEDSSRDCADSPQREGEVDSNEGSASVYATVDMAEGEEDGEVKREEATLLERSLVGAGVSRTFDVQGPFPSFPVAASGQSASEQITPTGSHLAQCGNCPHCGQKYSNQSALKYHVRLMHSDLTNRLCCYLCPRSFTQRESYKTHMWEKHKVRW